MKKRQVVVHPDVPFKQVYHATINASDTEPLRAVIIKSPPGEEEVR